MELTFDSSSSTNSPILPAFVGLPPNFSPLTDWRYEYQASTPSKKYSVAYTTSYDSIGNSYLWLFGGSENGEIKTNSLWRLNATSTPKSSHSWPRD